MTTTIQISHNVKEILKSMKTGKETYEQIIFNMINEIKKRKTEQEEFLIEGCKEMAEDSLRICEEFKYVDVEVGCEWNGDL